MTNNRNVVPLTISTMGGLREDATGELPHTSRVVSATPGLVHGAVALGALAGAGALVVTVAG
ncbi:hypothetical protein AAH978_19720 [Streptomyces sp. ZYX-F-203]